MPGGFQGQVNVQPAPAVAGDFASANPRATLNVGPGGLVAGAGGVTVGAFAWTVPPVDPDNTDVVAQSVAPSIGSNFPGTTGQPNAVAGFVHREGQALITTFLSDATLVIPQGLPVVVSTQGDFWVKNSGSSQALVGQKAFALLTSGLAVFGLAGGTGVSSTAVTGSVGSLTASMTGSITGDVLTVTALSSGTVTLGSFLNGTVGGTAVATNTQVVSQITGAAGGTGTYLVSIAEQVVQSGTITGSYALLSVTASGAFNLAVGNVLSGASIPPNVMISQFGTGTGGTGTYFLNWPGTAIGSETITTSGAVETKWYAASSGNPGELVKITSWVGSLG